MLKKLSLQKLKQYKTFQVRVHSFSPLSANLKKWSNTLKQFVDKLGTNCFSVFDHFVGLPLKVLVCTQSFLPPDMHT